MNAQKGSIWGFVLVIFLGVATLGTGIWYYFYLTKKPATAPAVQKTITWLTPEKIPDLKIFSLEVRPKGGRYYKVGIINKGQYAGGEIILAFAEPAATLGLTDDLYRFIRKDDKLYLLTKYSTQLYQNDGLDRSMFTQDQSYTLPDLDAFATTITYGQLQLIPHPSEINLLFDSNGLKKLFTDSKLGDVYTNASLENLGSYEVAKNCFFVKAPDGTVKFYRYTPPFLDEQGRSDITWQDGTKANGAYTFRSPSGSGFNDCANVVNLSTSEIKKAGTTSTGDPVYIYKDSNHPVLKKIYQEDYVVPSGGIKESYSQFIDSYPVFFWEDPFGRWVQFANNTYLPPAECAKPVIYLYPRVPSVVSVKLTPLGGIDASLPSYLDGWRVIAFPSGKLLDFQTNKIYPYLFWEGKSDLYQTPQKGFVVKNKELDQFFNYKLKELGLLEKEIADFKAFWIPQMLAKDAPYYFITFLAQSEINRLAPLSVQPAPDTVIRVLMDFKPLRQPITVSEPRLITPKREGFTVVEWGGVRR